MNHDSRVEYTPIPWSCNIIMWFWPKLIKCTMSGVPMKLHPGMFPSEWCPLGKNDNYFLMPLPLLPFPSFAFDTANDTLPECSECIKNVRKKMKVDERESLVFSPHECYFSSPRVLCGDPLYQKHIRHFFLPSFVSETLFNHELTMFVNCCWRNNISLFISISMERLLKEVRKRFSLVISWYVRCYWPPWSIHRIPAIACLRKCSTDFKI